jgi:hypothetical protein
MDLPPPPPKPSPLTRQPWFFQDWQCNVCYDTYSKKRLLTTWTTRENLMVCRFCITPIFEKILEYDFYYPARWAGEELHVEDFDDVLSKEFVVWYKQKGAEITARRKAAWVESPEGLTRGVDYQVCPRCKSCVGLEDGCNHISCLCGGSFCFLCGDVAFDDGSGHWDVGGCPRYNAKGSGREQYDGVAGGYADIFSDEESSEEGDREEGGSEEDESEDDEDDGDYEDESDDDDDNDLTTYSQSRFRPRNGHGNLYDLYDRSQMQDIALALGFASHDFNMAMQFADGNTKAKLMRLFATPSPDLASEERKDILASMDLSVPADDWHKHQGRRVHIHELLLDHILATPGVPRGGQHDFLFHIDYHGHELNLSSLAQGMEKPSISVLRKPVGGFLNLTYSGPLRVICMWLERVTTTPLPLGQTFCAIFDHEEAHSDAWSATPQGPQFLLRTGLPGKAFVLRDRIVTFESMHMGVLVRARPRYDGTSDPYVLNNIQEGTLDGLADLLMHPDEVKLATTVGLTWALEAGQALITHWFLTDAELSILEAEEKRARPVK